MENRFRVNLLLILPSATTCCWRLHNSVFKDMANKQLYTQRWSSLKYAQGDAFKAMMHTPLKSLLEKYTGSLEHASRVKMEVELEVKSEPGVEAVTPPVYLLLK